MKKTHNDWPIVFHWTVQPVRVYISGSGSLRKHMKKPHYGFQWSVGVYTKKKVGAALPWTSCSPEPEFNLGDE